MNQPRSNMGLIGEMLVSDQQGSLCLSCFQLGLSDINAIEWLPCARRSASSQGGESRHLGSRHNLSSPPRTAAWASWPHHPRCVFIEIWMQGPFSDRIHDECQTKIGPRSDCHPPSDNCIISRIIGRINFYLLQRRRKGRGNFSSDVILTGDG